MMADCIFKMGYLVEYTDDLQKVHVFDNAQTTKIKH